MASALTELADVRGPDVQHHADPRRGGGGQRGDVPDAAGGELQHQEPGVGVRPQHRVRVAELVVERLRRRHHGPGAARAPRRSGPWSRSFPTEPVTPDDRESCRRSTGARHARPARRARSSTAVVAARPRAVAEPRRPSAAEPRTATAPALAAADGEVVPVDGLAVQRHEQRARGDLAGVELHRADHGPVGSARRRRPAPTGRGTPARATGTPVGRRHLGDRHRDHPAVPSSADNAASQLVPVGERVHDAGDLLALLVALAGDHHRVAGAGRARPPS